MTDRVNPSFQRNAGSFVTAVGSIAQGGGTANYVTNSGPTDVATDDPNLDETALNQFVETSSGSSLDVDIDAGEGFISGAWVARDVSTTVTLPASTTGTTVYVGWEKGAANTLTIGESSAFDSLDQKTPLFTYDTDGSGVTAVTDERTLGKTLDGRFVNNTNTISSDYTTSGEQLLFVDTSSNPVTVTLSTQDRDTGSNVIVVDSGGNAGNNAITVTTEGSATVNGGANALIEDEYAATAVASDGSNWFTSGSGGGGGAFSDEDGDTVVELLAEFAGVQLNDDVFIEFGTDSDMSVLYDSANDDLRWRDKTNTTDIMALDRTTGDLTISGQIIEGANL